jgi:hypothetical protein
MVSPLAHINEDLFFGSMMHMDEPIDGLSVVVIAVLATHEEVETALFGWSTAMLEPHSLAWLSGRFPTPPPALTT